MKIRIDLCAIAGFWLCLSFATGSMARAADSSCIGCHKTVEHQVTAHSFMDWQNSAHGKAEIGCHYCHGGNPALPGKAEAHQGLRPSSDPRSPVYFTQVPRTCGSCHDAEFKAFRASSHSKELRRAGRGPNCVTCHGSMANHVMAARELEATCTLCHRRPTQAYAARLAVEEARAAVNQLDLALARLRDKGRPGLEPSQKRYGEALSIYRQSQVQWHSFETDKVLALARQASRLASSGLAELKSLEGVSP
ncbi:MAG: hypothetical protein HY549_06945 [Elusimicrobia bacterium]|nr:hypothetical protein [Elusimicrobiota bacterium]